MKIVYLIAYEGYQQVEYLASRAVVEKAKIDVVVASSKKGNALAKDGSSTRIDLSVDQVKVEDYRGLVIIGGPGALDWLDNAPVHELIRSFFNAGKMVAAICIAPRILARAGILAGKHVTGWDEDSALGALLESVGAIYKKESVVQDEKIITATGPAAAKDFGQAIVALLKMKK